MPTPPQAAAQTTVTAKTLARLAKKPGRHPVEKAKDQGLKLTVKKNGLAYWTYRYRLDGRETELSLGAYDNAMGLDEAIAAHADKRALVLKGIDPQEGKRQRRTPVSTRGDVKTFGEAAEAYLEQCEREQRWRSAKHRRQWRATLMSLPEWFRRLKIPAIGSEEVYKALKPIWDRTPETGSRLRSRIELVLNSTYGPKDDHANPAAMSRWLKDKLGKKRVNKDSETGGRVHHRALHHNQIPALMARLRDRPSVPARALEFLILTAARAGEVRGMTWDELKPDYAEDVAEPIATWIVPAFRMKAFRQHRAPLSSAAVAVLEARREQRKDGDALVFPGARPKKPLINNTLMNELKRLGFAALTTTHGLRASFRSWCKAMGVPFETAEEALAHAVGSQTSQAYDRDDRLALRVELMEAWARYCLSAPLSLPKPEATAVAA
jgi:integrase